MTLPPSHTLARPGLAPVRIAEAVRRLLTRPSFGTGLETVELELPTLDLLTWLAAQPFAERFAWRSADTDMAFAAVGAAETVEADRLGDLAGLRDRLDALGPAARFVGGARFDTAAAPSPDWAAFGAVRFVLPRAVLMPTPGGSRLTVNLVPADRHRVAAVVSEVRRLVLTPPRLVTSLPQPIGRTDMPDKARWMGAVSAALGAFETGPLDKVVLARRIRFELEEIPPPEALAARLAEAAPHAHQFLVSDGAGRAFLGATPERLLHVEDQSLRTEAVAGTRPRRQRAALAASEKDAREHAFVREAIRDTLAPLTLRLDAAADQVAAAHVRHLRTRLHGTLRPGVGPLDVLAALHPTPAVGGTPTPAALSAIRDLEGFDRGRYAGPVGWVSRDAADFAVGIRSGLLDGASLSLYAGAGIVPGSDPAAEWTETEAKLGAFLDALGLNA